MNGDVDQIQTNQYGYGIDPLMQQFILALSTRNQAGQSGRMQDLVSMIFDPKFASFGGNFDPYATTPEAVEPNIAEYANLYGGLNSTVPEIKQVAEWIRDGKTDAANAAAYIKDKLGITEYETPNGFTPAAVDQMVARMFDDVAQFRGDQRTFLEDQAKARAENVFTKAGLPVPTAQYTTDRSLVAQDPYNYVELPYTAEPLAQMQYGQKLLDEVSSGNTSLSLQRNRALESIYKRMMDDYQKSRADEAARIDAANAAAAETARVEEERVAESEGSNAEAFANQYGLDVKKVRNAMSRALSDATLQFGISDKDVFANSRSREFYNNMFKQYLEREVGLSVETYEKMSPEARAFFDAQTPAGPMVDVIPTRRQPVEPTIQEKKPLDQEQEARRGIAMSYKAAEQAKALPAISDQQRQLNLKQARGESALKEADMYRLGQLIAARNAGRNPTRDAMMSRLYSALGM